MAQLSMQAIRVWETPEQGKSRTDRLAKGKPDHWVDAKGEKEFQNPWPSWQSRGIRESLVAVRKMSTATPAVPPEMATRVRKPDWGSSSPPDSDKIKATWLGHACFLVELPTRSSTLARGPRILFDPVFSERCSPVQFYGPKRFTPAPCDIDDIPEIDAIVISHNHYDHLDTHTITTLLSRSRKPHIFAPLGNLPYFCSLGVPASHTHILDWWDSRRVEISIPAINTDKEASEQHSTPQAAFDITCTPAQHGSGRGILDQFRTLWAGWVVEEVSQDEGPKGVNLYFAGDTGYRAVRDGENEETAPVCPVFKEIGKRFGGFDLALIPIGAYSPRDFCSRIHCAPQDSVRVFKDVQAKRALGMHWGTWVLTEEEILEPPRRLAEECKKIGIPEDKFSVCDIGETVVV